LWLSLVNLDPAKPAEIRLAIPGVKAKVAAGTVLTAAKVNTINSFDAPDAVKPQPIAGRVAGGAVTVRVPAKSATMLEIVE